MTAVLRPPEPTLQRTDNTGAWPTACPVGTRRRARTTTTPDSDLPDGVRRCVVVQCEGRQICLRLAETGENDSAHTLRTSAMPRNALIGVSGYGGMYFGCSDAKLKATPGMMVLARIVNGCRVVEWGPEHHR